MQKSTRFALLCIVGLFSITGVSATMPILPSDVELAQSPIIVVGYWPKAKLVDHDRRKYDLIELQETHTKLIVTRVIQGSIKPGTYDMSYGPWVNWGRDGTGLNSNSSTFMFGEVENVSKPNLWFLKPAKSWDKRDQKTYLHIETFRSIQPIGLESYFQVMRRKDRNQLISSCLRSKDPLVVDRALSFVSGRERPWPLNPYQYKKEYEEYRKKTGDKSYRSERILSQIASVKAVAEGRVSKSRPYAEALYAEMAGRKSIPLLQKLVHDKDMSVKAIALAFLIQFNVPGTPGNAETICMRLADRDLSTELILAMERSRNPRYVPCIMSFLDRDKFPVKPEDNFLDASFCARDVLKRITLFEFPLDAKAARNAWIQVKGIRDQTRRVSTLTRILGDWKDALSAVCRPVLDSQNVAKLVLNKEGEYETIFDFTVTNQSNHIVTIPRKPTSLDWNAPSSGGGGGTGFQANSRNSFITLKPKKQIIWRMPLTYSFIHADQPGEVEIGYSEDGKKFGVRAWMGDLKVKIERHGQKSPKRIAVDELPGHLQNLPYEFLRGAKPVRVLRGTDGMTLQYYLKADFDTLCKQAGSEIKGKGGGGRQKIDRSESWRLGQLFFSFDEGRVTVSGNEEGGSYGTSYEPGTVTVSIGPFRY